MCNCALQTDICCCYEPPRNIVCPEITRMLRWPSFRRSPDILFMVACIGLVADVLVPEIWGHGKTKDYALWYWAGQQVLHAGDLYKRVTNGTLDFIYPPPAAILLAIPSYFGKLLLYTCLSALNVVAWWMTAQFSNAMTGSGRTPGPWLFALPGFVTISSVFDMFDLGQPNLVLLAMMLFGFWLLQHERPWIAGSMFALATAIKVFPVAVFPYLVWRRRWSSLASTVVFLGVLLFVMPAHSRTTSRSNAEELGILFCLMTVASPLARQYYFMWLFYPITILIHRATYDPRAAVRTGTWAALAIAGLLLCLSLPVFPNALQAYGNNLAATAVIAGGLVWHMLRPPSKLKPEMQNDLRQP